MISAAEHYTHFYMLVTTNTTFSGCLVPPLLLQVFGSAVPAPHCDSDSSCGLLMMVL